MYYWGPFDLLIYNVIEMVEKLGSMWNLIEINKANT